MRWSFAGTATGHTHVQQGFLVKAYDIDPAPHKASSAQLISSASQNKTQTLKPTGKSVASVPQALLTDCGGTAPPMQGTDLTIIPALKLRTKSIK